MSATVSEEYAHAERFEELSNALAERLLEQCEGSDIDIVVSALSIVFLNAAEVAADSAKVPHHIMKQQMKEQFDLFLQHLKALT